MHAIDELIRFDLNLLVVLHVLLDTRSVSATARRLGRTQSAISHALGRLRDVFDDPLLVRTGNRMRPTPLAEALAEPTRRATASTRAVFERRPFDPATMLRRFDLAMSGYAAAVLLVPLLRALAVRAPDVDLQVLRCDDSERAARNGEIAAGIGAFHHTVDGLRRRVLFSDEFVCAARIGHPGFMAPLDSSRFVQFDHVLVSPRGKPGSQVDTRLRGLGLTRRVRLVTQSFELALQAVADSDMVITVPKRLVQARRDRLVATSLPFSMPSFTVSMIFGDIYLTDPAQRWLRDLIGKIALDADSGHQSNS